MNRKEIKRMIRTLSKRRHRAILVLAALLDYPASNRADISKQRTFIHELGKEIDALIGRLA